MANIDDKVTQIRQAVYGKDVRESIASGIEAINDETESTTAKQAQLDTTFQQLIINAGNSNAEIVDARGGFDTLRKKLDSYAINVKDFGAKGDGVTDDTQAIQTAIDFSNVAKTIFFPKGTYKISSSINFKIGDSIVGENRNSCIINMIGDDFAFKCLTPLSNGGDVNNAGCIQNLSIYAKNAIQLNQSGDYDTIFSKQYSIKSFHINNCTFEGKYPSFNDTNAYTDVPATKEELLEYGVGIYFSKVFDSSITNCQIQNFGIGIYFDGSDINKISNCRIAYNARHYHSYHHDAYGSQNKIQECDILNNKRLYGIYLEYSFFESIKDNYFENYYPSACMIKIYKGIGCSFILNRIDSTKQSSIPVISIEDGYGHIVMQNRLNPSDINPPVEVIYTTREAGDKKIIAIWKDNSPQFPIPDVPFVITSNINNYLLRYDNFPMSYINSGTVGIAFTKSNFIYKGALNKWVFKTYDGGSSIFNFYIESPKHSKLKIIFTAYCTSSAQYTVIKHGTTTLFANHLGMPYNTGQFEKKEIYITLSETDLLINPYITIEFGSFMELYSIEIVPVNEIKLPSAPTTGFWNTGDIVYNTNPTAGGYIGWVCVAGGTPGTWKGFGTIQA